jgi:hypothetical protein
LSNGNFGLTLISMQVVAIAFGCLFGGMALSLIAVQVYRKYHTPTPYVPGQRETTIALPDMLRSTKSVL